MLKPNFPNVAAQAPSRAFKKRSYLPLESTYLWEIENGFVRTLTWLEDGTVTTLGIWGAGDFVGRSLSGVVPLEIQCLSPVSAKPIFLQDDTLARERLLLHLQQVEELMVIRSHLSTEMRLIKLLGWLSRRYGSIDGKNKTLEIGLSHQDLSETIGTTRVTVTRLLGQLESNGSIERLSQKRMVLHAPETWYYQI